MNAPLSWGQKTDVPVICPKCRRKTLAAIDWDRDLNLGARLTWTFACNCGFHRIDIEFTFLERLLLSLPYVILPVLLLVVFGIRAGNALRWDGVPSFASMAGFGILFFVVGFQCGKAMAASRIQADLNQSADSI